MRFLVAAIFVAVFGLAAASGNGANSGGVNSGRDPTKPADDAVTAAPTGATSGGAVVDDRNGAGGCYYGVCPGGVTAPASTQSADAPSDSAATASGDATGVPTKSDDSSSASDPTAPATVSDDSSSRDPTKSDDSSSASDPTAPATVDDHGGRDPTKAEDSVSSSNPTAAPTAGSSAAGSTKAPATKATRPPTTPKVTTPKVCTGWQIGSQCKTKVSCAGGKVQADRNRSCTCGLGCQQCSLQGSSATPTASCMKCSSRFFLAGTTCVLASSCPAGTRAWSGKPVKGTNKCLTAVTCANSKLPDKTACNCPDNCNTCTLPLKGAIVCSACKAGYVPNAKGVCVKTA